jgi:hypothetical protein
MEVMDTGASGDFGSGWTRDAGDEPFESAHDGPVGGDHLSSGMLGAQGLPGVHDVADGLGLGDAGASPFHFDPVDMDSHDDFDLNGDGVVDHADVHSALHGLHDFHAPDHVPDPADAVHHHEPDPGFFHH